MSLLKSLLKVLPTLGFAFILALAVWVNAVTASDPNQEKIYPRVVEIEYFGLDPDVVIVGDPANQATITINAPLSIWNRLTYEDGLVTAKVDLTGLGPGTYTERVDAEVALRAADITAVSPPEVTVTLEPLSSRSLNINLVRVGEPSIGFQAGDPQLSEDTVTISGAESLVNSVSEVRATLNLGDAHESIVTSVSLQALDADENIVEGVSLSPDKIDINQPITQEGGYKNVVVNVVTSGEIASGYRLTNISVFPLAVTVFSSDPQKVNDLPGYVETMPVDIDGATDDLDVQVALNLPVGISVVGDQEVLVRVGIAAIESSERVANLTIETIGLGEGLVATFAPETVDVIVAGPLPVLDALSPTGITVQVDVTGYGIGTHQIAPKVTVNSPELQITSILPDTLEVTIQVAPTPTPTRRP